MLLNTKAQKRNNVAQIYESAFNETLNKVKDEYSRRLILKELDVNTGADERILTDFAKRVIELAEKQIQEDQI